MMHVAVTYRSSAMRYNSIRAVEVPGNSQASTPDCKHPSAYQWGKTPGGCSGTRAGATGLCPSAEPLPTSRTWERGSLAHRCSLSGLMCAMRLRLTLGTPNLYHRAGECRIDTHITAEDSLPVIREMGLFLPIQHKTWVQPHLYCVPAE